MKDSKVLVDTSVWIFALKKNFHPQIKERVETLLRENIVVTLGLIRLELLGGAKTEKEFRRLRGLWEELTTIETSEYLWGKASELAFYLRRNGLTVPHTDILVAVAAIEAEVLLLHADSHFDLIAKHTELRAENLQV